MKYNYIKLPQKVEAYQVYGDLSGGRENIPFWVVNLFFIGDLQKGEPRTDKTFILKINGQEFYGKQGDFVVRYRNGDIELVSDVDFHTYFGRAEEVSK